MTPTLHKLLRILCLLFIFFQIALSLVFIFHKDIYFHTDIARDFLLIEDIVRNHHFTLLGPRSGGIPGVFHGPLWLYVSVPAFIFLGGDPSGFGVFWFVLGILYLVVVYLITHKVYTRDTALIATTLASGMVPPIVGNLFNPFGAVIFAPILFYFGYVYWRTFKARFLILFLFFMGICIQFQMAWGGPMLVLALPPIMYRIFRYKKWSHLLMFAVLSIPLSSFVIFDLRHSFLQTFAVLKHITGGNGEYGTVSPLVFLTSRLRGMLMDGWYITRALPGYLSLLLFTSIVVVLHRSKTRLDEKVKMNLKIFLYFYTGFWLLTFLFRGVIWDYYYWPFAPLVITMLSALIHHFPRWFMIMVLTVLCTVNIYTNIQFVRGFSDFSAKDVSSWLFSKEVAEWVYTDATEPGFGYFIFTPDQYGYSQRYAMNYIQTVTKAKVAKPFAKSQITYLLIAPAPTYRPELNGGEWKRDKLGIVRPADKVKSYPNGYVIEKYLLSPDELKVPADPNLIHDLTFR